MNNQECWFNAIANCKDLETRIKDVESTLNELRDDRAILYAAHDKAASDYAAERAAEGANAVEGPDGNLYMIRKMKKRKGGGDPPYAFALDPVKR